MHNKINVRSFTRQDIPQLLCLMKKLAIFENYIDDFKVTENDLATHGLGKDPIFKSLVAEQDERLLGYLVYYTIPFTYDLKPKVIMKELYVVEMARGKSVGSLLMNALKTKARDMEAGKIEWLILPSNEAAKRFYRHHGATQDINWETWNIQF